MSGKLLEVRWRRCQFYILPLDFIPAGGPLSGSCYKAFTAPETWNNAEAKCKRLGVQLVKIESAEENDFLTRTFLKAPKGTYWIGLSDQMIEGKWIWTDESLLGKYTNWGKLTLTTSGMIKIVDIFQREVSSCNGMISVALMVENGMTWDAFLHWIYLWAVVSLIKGEGDF